MNQGWKELPDYTGKAPRHVEAAQKSKHRNILESPILPPNKNLFEKWSEHLNRLDKNHSGFEMFDYNSGEASVDEIEEILEGGQEVLFEKIDELRDNNESAEYDMFLSNFEKFLRDEKIDRSDVEDIDEFRMEFEGHTNWNIEKLFDFNVLLIEKKKYDIDISYDGASSELDESDDEQKEFKEKALQYITPRQLNTLLINSYGGAGYFGIITNGQDIIKAIRDNEKTDNSSEVIVGIHDWFNGSGYFERGHASPNYTVKLKDVEVDSGKYGVGGVFGTNEWKWK